MVRLLYPSLQAPVLTTAQIPETVTESRWHQPWSEPVRRVVATCLVVAAATFVSSTPTASTGSGIFFEAGWAGPTFTNTVLYPAYPAYSGAVFSTIAPVSSWTPQWESTRVPNGLLVANQQTLAYSALPLQVYFSYGDISPLPGSRPFLAAQQQFLAPLQWGAFQGPATILESFQPFGTPVSIRGLPVHEQQVLAFAKAIPFPETVSADRWFIQVSEPVRYRGGLNTQDQEDCYFVNIAPLVFAVPLVSYPQVSEPVRIRLGLPAYEQQTLAFAEASFLETVTVDRWLLQWEPTRRLATPAANQQALAFVWVSTGTMVSAGSFAELPYVPSTRPFQAAQQQALVFLDFQPIAFTGSGKFFDIGWTGPTFTQTVLYQAWTRVQLGSFVLPTIPTFGWRMPFSEPPRVRPGMTTNQQPFLSYVTFVPAGIQFTRGYIIC